MQAGVLPGGGDDGRGGSGEIIDKNQQLKWVGLTSIQFKHVIYSSKSFSTYVCHTYIKK